MELIEDVIIFFAQLEELKFHYELHGNEVSDLQFINIIHRGITALLGEPMKMVAESIRTMMVMTKLTTQQVMDIYAMHFKEKCTELQKTEATALYSATNCGGHGWNCRSGYSHDSGRFRDCSGHNMGSKYAGNHPLVMSSRKTASSRSSASPGCLCCGKTDHWMSACPRHYCSNCHSNNHWPKDCPNNEEHADVARTVSKGLIVDSGALCSMVANASDLLFYSLSSSPTTVKTANNERLESKGTGTFSYTSKMDTGLERLEMKDTIYVPGLPDTLLSVSQLCSNGYEVTFRRYKMICEIRDKENKLVTIASAQNGLYRLKNGLLTEATAYGAEVIGNSALLWHSHLRHPGMQMMMDMLA